METVDLQYFWKHYYLSVGTIGCALCLIFHLLARNSPLIDSYSEGTITHLNAITVKYYLVAGCAISGQMLLDILVDNASSPKKLFYSRGSDFIFIVLLCLFIPDVAVLSYIIPFRDTNFLLTIGLIRFIALTCAVCSYGRQYAECIFGSKTLKLAAFVGIMGMVIQISALMAPNRPLRDKVSFGGNICQIIASCLFFYEVARWIQFLIKYHHQNHSLTKDQIDCTVYVISYIVVALSQWILIFIFDARTVDNLSTDFLIWYFSIFTFYLVIQAMFIARSRRREAANYKQELDFKRMFVRYISHEVRTPLNTAKLGLQYLAEEMSGSHSDWNELLEVVRDIQTSCDVSVNILNELLTFDKLEEKKLVLEKNVFFAYDYILRTIKPFQIQAKKLGVVLFVDAVESEELNDFPIADICLSADRHKLAQVLRNLVSNGLKFTGSGGSVSVEVTIAKKRSKLSLVVRVIDTGAGISQENQKKLFKEVVQFNPGKLQAGGGSGLGMYISDGIVALHGGTISVFSKGEGYGSTFTLELPAFPNPEAAGCSRKVLESQRSLSRSRIMMSSSATLPDELKPTDAANKNRLSNYRHDNNSKSVESVLVYPLAESTPSGGHLSVQRIKYKLSESESNEVTIRDLTNQVKIYNQEDKNDEDNNDNHVNNTTNTNNNKSNMNNFPSSGTISPFRDQSAREFEHKTTDHHLLSTPFPNPTKFWHVLLVDDSALNRKMASRLLLKRFSSFEEAENGYNAVEKVRVSLSQSPVTFSRSFDLILMDVEMPRMDGHEATRRIREIGYKGIIFGISGNVTPDDVKVFLEAGADKVLSKPLDIRKFDQAIASLQFNL